MVTNEVPVLKSEMILEQEHWSDIVPEEILKGEKVLEVVPVI